MFAFTSFPLRANFTIAEVGVCRGICPERYAVTNERFAVSVLTRLLFSPVPPENCRSLLQAFDGRF